MAHVATKRFNYWGQLAILLALTGVGLIIGQAIGIVIFLSKDPTFLTDTKAAMDKMLVPANANILRITQLIAVIFMFILPAFLYAKICHKKALLHLGIQNNVYLPQLLLVIAFMFSALPLVGAFRELTMSLPLGEYIQHKIAQSKDEYMKNVLAIGAMRNFGEYLTTLFIMAILPGFAEELFFRGALQNLFTRWFKAPIVAILLTGFLFSVIHFEYSDFIGRFFLGVVLGWVFYLTGNLWLNMTMHAAFNGLSVTALYISTRSAGKIDAQNIEDHFNVYLTAGALAAFILFGYFLYTMNKKRNTAIPGEEILLPGYINSRNQLVDEIEEIGNENQA
ncbi:lysostaphin resistance A-like protein [Ferruginibacter sp. SUN106]|uniref:CPBP family intramembrane glutamic endopeptidase n=1 Tax=Ferruginibacter sp. SUN106 TaxID=2978348 RepID=UPI003D368C91